MQNVEAKIRWHGLDLIRLLSFSVILTFQTGLIYFWEPTYVYAQYSQIQHWAEIICRSFAFSGFSIVFLSAFLLGYAHARPGSERRTTAFFVVLLFGWVYLSYLVNSGFFIVWDVFGLFLLAMVLLTILKRRGPIWIRVAAIGGFVLLWIPVWQFSSAFAHWPALWREIVGVAACEGKAISEWPLLPWAGLVSFGYGLGCELEWRVQKHGRQSLPLTWPEALVWLAILGLSIPQWGPYFRVRLGAYFSCDAYRQPPLVFWSHFIWVLAALRLSVEPRVHGWLAQQRWAQSVSSLAISRKFWLAYALHYFYAHALCHIAVFFETYTPDLFARFELLVIDILTVTLVLQVEAMTRIALNLARRVQHFFLSFLPNK